MAQRHRDFSLVLIANVTMEVGHTGSSRKISIAAPVFFLNNSLAGMTFVLLKNRIEFEGRKSSSFEKLA
jgi:hypothetical protein